MTPPALNLAVVGAGPVGLALALHAATALPQARVTLFDARPADRDVGADPRTLALALGSVQLLRRLGAWPAEAAQPITEVHVSQAPPAALPWGGMPEVRLTARAEGVPMLGAVLRYGTLVARLQRAWLAQAAAAPARLQTRFGAPVAALAPRPDGVAVDAGSAETFDLAVVAEGGVFATQARKALAHDYGQTAWVGKVVLDGAPPGTAFERFTRDGPLALLPLPAGADAADAAADAAADGTRQAALVWCVASANDPVQPLAEAQRLALLRTLLPEAAGRPLALTALQPFALGLNAERTLVQGRIVRIGNAAQTLHPVAGQGLNLGLRDAFALVEALRFAARPEAALARVEWTRAPDRWSTIAVTDFLARSFTWRAPGVAAARALALAALERTSSAKSLLARQMMFGLRAL